MVLTNDDKQFIKTLLDDKFEFKLDEKVEEKVKKYVGNLPTKDEFNSRMDEMMGELKGIREELSMLSLHSKDHSDAIETLQKIHPHNSHPTLA